MKCTKNNFDILKVSETKITEQVSILNNWNINNYCYEFTPTKTTEGGTFLYIATHLSYKCCNNLNIYKMNELLLKLPTLKNEIFLRESFTYIYPWILLTLIAVT